MTTHTASSASSRPLAGLRVIEFAQMVAAPSAALLLADYGADVIKVEPIEGDNARQLRSAVATDLPVSPVFLGYNRGKRLIRLDLRKPDDLASARDLVAGADVLIESSRPGAMTRLGLGPDAMHALNARLIYASISGFGWTPSTIGKRGVDLIIQAESGIMSLTGPPSTPMKVGFTMVDAASGHALCHGILAALYQRERTGRGEVVQVSLYDVALHLQTGPLVEYMMTGQQAPRSGNSAPLSAPADLLQCGVGAIVISAYLEAHWRRFIALIDGEHLAQDARFSTVAARIEQRAALIVALEALLISRPAAEWEQLLGDAGLLVGQVKDHAAVACSPYSTESRILETSGGVHGVHNPAQLGSAPRAGFVPPVECNAAEICWQVVDPGPQDA